MAGLYNAVFYEKPPDVYKLNKEFCCISISVGLLSVSLFQKLGMLALINEESRFPKGTDYTLLEKLHSRHAVSTHANT